MKNAIILHVTKGLSLVKTEPHLLLFTLEVEPVQVGVTYDDLPLHCTLMHRFFSGMPVDALADAVRPIFDDTHPVVLTSGENVSSGPRQVRVNKIALTLELTDLHARLYDLLNKLGAEYTAPQWVGAGFKPHVTERPYPPYVAFPTGSVYASPAAYLIEIVDKKRCVRATFDLR